MHVEGSITLVVSAGRARFPTLFWPCLAHLAHQGATCRAMVQLPVLPVPQVAPRAPQAGLSAVSVVSVPSLQRPEAAPAMLALQEPTSRIQEAWPA